MNKVYKEQFLGVAAVFKLSYLNLVSEFGVRKHPFPGVLQKSISEKFHKIFTKNTCRGVLF